MAKVTEAELLALCPTFGPWWNDERDLWVDDDGEFATHGVFAAFSHFVADRLSRGPAMAFASRIRSSGFQGLRRKVAPSGSTGHSFPDVITIRMFAQV